VTTLTEINLNMFNMRGTLPDSIGQFDSITTINLSWNFLYGTIPATIMATNPNGLKKRQLFLGNNDFSGKVPEIPGSQFYNSEITWTNSGYGCGLSQNPLTCPLPSWASKCENTMGQGTVCGMCWDECPGGQGRTLFEPPKQWRCTTKANTNTSDCADCPAGQFSKDSARCVICPIGKYQGAAGQPSCHGNCPAGKYAPAGSEACVRCPGGKFSNSVGYSCRNCPVGSVSAAGDVACTGCAAGHYQPDAGQPAGSCFACPEGFYAEGGRSSCSPTTCPLGLVSLAGAKSRTDCRGDCPPGQYVDGARGCVSCAAGSYLNGTHCAPCAVDGCCDENMAISYVPTTACSEQCATELGARGSRLFNASSVVNASSTNATSTTSTLVCANFASRIALSCGSAPCDSNLLSATGFIAYDPYPVQSQGQCGSCYSFAAAHAYSARVAQWRAAKGYDMALGQPTLQMVSPQYLVSCSKEFAAGLCAHKGYSCGGGCEGGFAIVAFEYMAGAGAATCSADGADGCVPYRCSGGADDATCQQAQCKYYTAPHFSGESCCQGGLEPGFLTEKRFSRWGSDFFTRDTTTVCVNTGKLLRPRDRGHCFSFNGVGWTPFMQYNIRREMTLNGLVTATMLVCESFHAFFSDDANANATYTQSCTASVFGQGGQGNDAVGLHEVVLAGWGVDDDDVSTPYWLVKNSWGKSWNAGGPQGGGYFKIKRGENTAGIEGTVCMIGPKTDILVPHAKFNPRAQWTLAACGFANNDTNQPFSAPSIQCDLGTTHKSGGWTVDTPVHADTSTYIPAVHAAVHHAVEHSGRRALAASNTTVKVLAAHSQSVAGVNRRVLVRVGGDGGAVVEARVHRDLGGQHSLLAEPIEHSCTASGDTSCTAHPDCCTATHAASASACGACIATKMHAELQDAPPPPSQKEVQAQAKAEGKTEGALMGSGITLVCIAAAQLLRNGAQRARTRRQTRSLEISAPAQAL
jgi:hypothetical protein